MPKNIWLLFFIISLLIGLPVKGLSASETLKEQADRICHAYIENPNSFETVKMTPCTDNQGNDNFCYKNGNKTYVSVSGNGTCHPRSIEELNADSSIKYLPASNATIDGYSWGTDDFLLKHQDQFLISSGYDLRLLQNDKTLVLCGFLYASQKWKPAEPVNKAVCQKFSEHNFFVPETKIAESQWEQWPSYPEARPVAFYESDLNHDGQKEKVINYDYSSGGGCGCDTQILINSHNKKLITKSDSQSESEATTDPEIENFSEKLFSLTSRCNKVASHIIQIDDKDYVLIGDLELKEKISQKIPTRTLWEYKDGDFHQICTQKTDTIRVIDYELYKGKERYNLNYKPLDEMTDVKK